MRMCSFCPLGDFWNASRLLVDVKSVSPFPPMYPAALFFSFREGEGKEAQRINSFPWILVFIPRKVKNLVFRTCLQVTIISVASRIPLILLRIQASDAWGRRTRRVWEHLSSHKVNTVQGRIKTRQIILPFQTAKLRRLSCNAGRVENFSEMIGLISTLGETESLNESCSLSRSGRTLAESGVSSVIPVL